MFLNKYFFFYLENIALYDECFGHVILYSYCCFWRQYNDLATLEVQNKILYFEGD